MQSFDKKKKKAKPGLGVLALIAIAVIGNIADALDRLPGSDTVLGVAAVIVVIVVFVIVFSVIRKRRETGTRPPLFRPKVEEDCHNRLHPEHAAECDDALTHWKKQLDGFLAAGIIDKNEYRVLMERYARELKR